MLIVLIVILVIFNNIDSEYVIFGIAVPKKRFGQQPVD